MIMIRHIVMWKFREECKEEAESFLFSLKALDGVIPEIKFMEVRKTLGGDYDALLISDFESLSDLETYKNDKRHKKVSSLCKSIRVSRASADYEI